MTKFPSQLWMLPRVVGGESMRRMFLPRIVLCCVALISSAMAAERPTKPQRLWDGDAPGATGTAEKDIPTLTPYWPAAESATGAAVIVCPGGGYRVLAPHEGEPYAKWLNSQGIAAFVLKYRLAVDGYYVPTSLVDAKRAMRFVRSHAAEWGIDPKRIGMMGSSAGGHLTATLSTQFDEGKADAEDAVERISSRPDIAVLCYAFILFDLPDPEREERFLGKIWTPEQKQLLSPRLNVRKDTPQTFVWQTVEDQRVPAENALGMAAALREKGVPFDLHLYLKGAHGIGLGTKEFDPEKLHPWTKDCAFWLKQQGFAK